jgi:hypothetical protein
LPQLLRASAQTPHAATLPEHFAILRRLDGHVAQRFFHLCVLMDFH